MVVIEQPLEPQLRALATNCRAPLVLCHELGAGLRRRGRGGVILVASLSGRHGTPLVATCAATKAFTAILGESLWSELRQGAWTCSPRSPGLRTPRAFAVASRGAAAPPGYCMWQRACSVPRALLYPPACGAEALGARGRPLGVPAPTLSRFAVDYVCQDLTFSTDKAARELGYHPAYSEAEALQRTVEHFQAAKDRAAGST